MKTLTRPIPPSTPTTLSVGPTVLVVDDDPVVVRSLTVLLNRAGFAVAGCGTAADAMSRAATPGDAPPVAAAVVDIHLPDANGLTLSQQLRAALGPAVPIIILSGDNSMQTIRALPDAGATYFFAKPVNTGMLISQLKQWAHQEPA
jgi:DNA-binding response OmpR family regulator